jgi:hypothetical protein
MDDNLVDILPQRNIHATRILKPKILVGPVNKREIPAHAAAGRLFLSFMIIRIAETNIRTLMPCDIEKPGKRNPLTASPLNVSTTDLITE